MSSNLPLRTIRIPNLRQQCLFQHRRSLQQPRAFSTTAPQAFASTSPRLRGQGGKSDKLMTKTAVKHQVGQAPGVVKNKAEQDGEMVEDIGLVQDTLVRASLRNLPGIWTPAFWGYWWKVVKNKATGMYSRSVYKRCIYKKGISSYFPIDAFNNKQTTELAKKYYVLIYDNFVKEDSTFISRFCLPPLTRDFQNRIAARGPLKMDWDLKEFRSAKVVSHRAVSFGEDQPDSAIRQLVVRIASIQKLTMTRGPSKKSPAGKTSIKRPSWVPDEVKQTKKEKVKKDAKQSTEEEQVGFADNGKEKKVVEYLVLQRRVIKGIEEGWKVWGFAPESTPEKIEEDALYWRKTLNAHAGAA